MIPMFSAMSCGAVRANGLEMLVSLVSCLHTTEF